MSHGNFRQVRTRQARGQSQSLSRASQLSPCPGRRRGREAPRFGNHAPPKPGCRGRELRVVGSRKKRKAGGRRKPQQRRRKRRQKESAGKPSSQGDPAYDTWAGGQEQSRGFRSECSGCFRKGGATANTGPAGDARSPCAPGALSGAAYLRWGRRHALPGTARGARGAEPGDLEPITQGRTRHSDARGLGWRWRLGKKCQWRSCWGRRGARRGPVLGAPERPR